MPQPPATPIGSSTNAGGKPQRQDSLDSIVRDLQNRVSALESLFRGSPTSVGLSTATFNTTGNNKVLLDSVFFDPNGNWDMANHRYVCPNIGFYLVVAQLEFYMSAPGEMIAILYVNGNQYSRGNDLASTTGFGLMYADIVEASPGDYFELYLWNQNQPVTDSTIGSRSRMSIAQVA